MGKLKLLLGLFPVLQFDTVIREIFQGKNFFSIPSHSCMFLCAKLSVDFMLVLVNPALYYCIMLFFIVCV